MNSWASNGGRGVVWAERRDSTSSINQGEPRTLSMSIQRAAARRPAAHSLGWPRYRNCHVHGGALRHPVTRQVL